MGSGLAQLSAVRGGDFLLQLGYVSSGAWSLLPCALSSPSPSSSSTSSLIPSSCSRSCPSFKSALSRDAMETERDRESECGCRTGGRGWAAV